MLDYRKRSGPVTPGPVLPVGSAAAVTPEQSRTLGELNAARIRLDRARQDLDDARSNNDDPMRKNVPVPWRQFFDAVTGAQRAMTRVVQAFDVR